MKIKLFFILLIFAFDANARTGVGLAYGTGTSNVHAGRIYIQKAWPHPCYTHNRRMIDGYWEFAFTRINSNQTFSVPTVQHVEVTSASAVLRLGTTSFKYLYFDLGIGAAYFSKQSIATRKLGSNLLFEDRLGVGALFGPKKSIEIGYRFLHFSNAYLAKKNDSVNLHLILIGYWF